MQVDPISAAQSGMDAYRIAGTDGLLVWMTVGMAALFVIVLFAGARYALAEMRRREEAYTTSNKELLQKLESEVQFLRTQWAETNKQLITTKDQMLAMQAEMHKLERENDLLRRERAQHS